MSLPQATKDISPHPKRNAVVDPVDKKAQAADVERKLRFYGVVQAFRKGRMPSNKQIEETLDYVLHHSPITTDKLSPEGKRLIQDVRDIIGTAKLMVQEKNADELFQNFVWHTQGASKSTDINDWKGVVAEAANTAPVDGEKARQDGEVAVRHLRTLLTLVLTNSEVRKLLSDFSLIGRDLLSIGVSKAAQTLAPHPDHLSHVDESAPNDQFITEGGRVAGPNETPVFEGSIPFTGKKVRHHPKEDTAFLQDQSARGTGGKPVGEAVSEGQQMYQEAREQGHRVGEEALGEARRQGEEYKEMDERGDEEGKEAKKGGFVNKMRQVRDNIRDGFNDRVPDDQKDRAKDRTNEKIERGKKFLTEEYFPEERRDQFIFRAKKVIIECQKHDDYQESMRWLLSYIEEYVKHGRTVAQSSHEHAREKVPADRDHPIKLATLELRTLLERFANNTPMDPIYHAADALIADASHDQGLRDWFQTVNTFMHKVLLQPGYILEPSCDSQGSLIRESGKTFYDDKYKGHFDDLWSAIGGWVKEMGEDELNKRFGDDWARLTRDLLFDAEGKLVFKRELWGDVRRVVMPQLIQKIGYIPIPRIEYTDDTLDLVVENLTLQGRNLFPNIVSFDVHNYVKFSPYDAIADDSHHKISFTMQHIQADMRDVAFYYHKKSGIPKMKDSGLADVLIGGEGVSAHITLVSTTRDRSSVFHVEDVTVKVDNVKFSIRDSKHDFLYKTLRPLATGLVKRQVQRAIRDGLRTGLEYVDGQLVGVRERMEQAKEVEGQSRADVLKELFVRGKEKKDEVDAKTDIKVERGGVGATVKSSGGSTMSGASGKESTFKIVADKRNSVLSGIGNPAGWVNRAEEKEGVVGKRTGHVVGTGGEQGWKSDAFTITPTKGGLTGATAGSGTMHSADATAHAARN